MLDLRMYSYLAAGLLEIAIPILLGVYVSRRYRVGWRVYGIGGVMFLLSLVRLPLNNVVAIYASGLPGSIARIVVFGFSSLTAGVFEELARYTAFNRLVKDRSIENGLMYGAGHGGVESIALAGLNVTVIGLLLAFSPTSIPTEQLLGILSVPPWLPLVGLYERVLAMGIQIGLSLVVLQAFIRGDNRYLLAAVGIHAAVDFAVLVVVSSLGIFWGEMAATVFAALICGYAWRVVRGSRADDSGEDQPEMEG